MVSASKRGRVLVTGGDGFTGRYLKSALERRGYSVVEHRQVDCDLRDASGVARFISTTQLDFAVHLAAISFVPHGSPAEIYAVNTVGTTNLLDALAQHRPAVRKVLLASSSQVYGNADCGSLDEASPCRPSSHYACSKLAMEHMAAAYSDRLPIVITRPFNYTGPKQPNYFLVPKIVSHFLRREPTIELGNIEIVRDFSDVRVVVDAYCRLLEASGSPGTFNICSGVGRSVRWLLEEVGRLTRHQIEIKVNADFVRSGDPPCMVGSNRQLVDAIGPLCQVDISQTLRWMLETAGEAPVSAS